MPPKKRATARKAPVKKAPVRRKAPAKAASKTVKKSFYILPLKERQSLPITKLVKMDVGPKKEGAGRNYRYSVKGLSTYVTKAGDRYEASVYVKPSEFAELKRKTGLSVEHTTSSSDRKSRKCTAVRDRAYESCLERRKKARAAASGDAPKKQTARAKAAKRPTVKSAAAGKKKPAATRKARYVPYQGFATPSAVKAANKTKLQSVIKKAKLRMPKEGSKKDAYVAAVMKGFNAKQE